MIPLLVKTCSASLQAYSPSARVKAAAAQVGDHNWNGEKNSCVLLMRNLRPLNEGQRMHETPGAHPRLILDRLYHTPSPLYLNIPPLSDLLAPLPDMQARPLSAANI
jgi:hypothetical protein